MAKEQNQMKQIQSMMGKYLIELSGLKDRLKELEDAVRWLEENGGVRTEEERKHG